MLITETKERPLELAPGKDDSHDQRHPGETPSPDLASQQKEESQRSRTQDHWRERQHQSESIRLRRRDAETFRDRGQTEMKETGGRDPAAFGIKRPDIPAQDPREMLHRTGELVQVKPGIIPEQDRLPRGRQHLRHRRDDPEQRPDQHQQDEGRPFPDPPTRRGHQGWRRRTPAVSLERVSTFSALTL